MIQIPASPTFSSDTEPESLLDHPLKFIQDNAALDRDDDLGISPVLSSS